MLTPRDETVVFDGENQQMNSLAENASAHFERYNVCTVVTLCDHVGDFDAGSGAAVKKIAKKPPSQRRY